MPWLLGCAKQQEKGRFFFHEVSLDRKATTYLPSIGHTAGMAENAGAETLMILSSAFIRDHEETITIPKHPQIS